MRRKKKIKIMVMLSFLMICALFVNILNPFNADTPKEIDITKNGGSITATYSTSDLDLNWNSSVMFDLSFNVGKNDVKEGDYFIIKMPKELKWHERVEPIVLNVPGTDDVWANVTFDKAANTAKVEFTKNAENKYNIAGLFILYSRVAEKQVLTQTPIEITVGEQVIFKGTIKVSEPKPYEHFTGEYFFKSWGSQSKYKNEPALNFYVRINKQKADLKNIELEDTITASAAVQFIPESFRLWEVEYIEHSDRLEIKKDESTLLKYADLSNNDATKPRLVIDDSNQSFKLMIPEPGNRSYFLDYYVTNPLTGERVKNKAIVREEGVELKPYNEWKLANYIERTSIAKHYQYGMIFGDIKGKLVIEKQDEKGNRLTDMNFNVKNEDGSYDLPFKTDSNGKIEISGLAEGKYTITEVNVPEYYEEPVPQVVDYKIDTGAAALFINRPKLVNLVVDKSWKGGDSSEYKVDLGLYRNIAGEEPKEVLDNFKNHIVKKVESGNPSETLTFENLRKYDENHNLYIYSVKELNLPDNYEQKMEVDPTNPYKISIINTKKTAPVEETIDITVTKKWTGHFDVPTREVEFTLQRQLPGDADFKDVLDGGGTKITAKIPQGAADPKVVFEDYPKFQYVAGVKGGEYTYRVLETPLTAEGYTTSYDIKKDEDGNYMIEVTNDRVLGMGGMGGPDPDPDPEPDSSGEGSGTVSKVERIPPKHEDSEEKKEPEIPKKEETESKEEPEKKPVTKPHEEPGVGKTGETVIVDQPATEVQPGVIPIQNQGGGIGTTDTSKQPDTSVSPNKGMLPKTGEGLNSSDYFVILSLFGATIAILGYRIKRKSKVEQYRK